MPDLSISLSSAGTEAESGAAICGFTAKALHGLPDGDAFVDAFRSTRLTVRDLEDAHLVLAASRGVRATIAGMVPNARSRTFTMLEAVALAKNLEKRNGKSGDVTELLSAPGMLAAALNDHRGLTPTHPMRRAQRVKGLHELESTLDIPDVHMGQARSHSGIQRTMRAAAQDFTQSVAALSRSSAAIS